MELYKQYIDKLSKKYIRKNDYVLDIGCGDGIHTKILKRYSNHVVGADLDNRLYKKNRIKFRKITPNNYGDQGKHDVVASFDVIEHVIDDIKFVKSKVKTLKIGGMLIIATPNRDRFSNKLISLMKGPIKYPRNLGYHFPSGGDIIHIREYTASDLRKLLSKVSGVKVKKIYSSFLGIYTPWGPIGFKNIDIKIFSKYSQHLFVIAEKIN